MKSTTRLWSQSLLLSAAATLVACGGGGDGDGGSNPNENSGYTSWEGSINGVAIKDAANEDFAVKSNTREVFHIERHISLSGLSVDGGAQVIYSGTIIGVVTLDTSTSGARVAVFKCGDGSRMLLNVSNSGWSHNCSNSSPGSGSIVRDPPVPISPIYCTDANTGVTSMCSGSGAIDADKIKAPDTDNCLKPTKKMDGSIDLLNICSQSVTVAFCYTKATSGSSKMQYICKPQKDGWALEGLNYATQWPGAVPSGGIMNIGWDPKGDAYELIYLGCITPYVIPIISSYTSGYCRRP